MFLLAFFALLNAADKPAFTPAATDDKIFTYTGSAASKAISLRYDSAGSLFSVGTTPATGDSTVSFGWAKFEEFLATIPAADAAASKAIYIVEDATNPIVTEWFAATKIVNLAEAKVAVAADGKVAVTGVTSAKTFYYHEGAAAGTSATATLTVVPILASALRPKTYLYEYTTGNPIALDMVHIVTVGTASARSAATHATEKKKVVITDTLGSNVTLPVAITGVEITDTHNSGFTKATITVTGAPTVGIVGAGKWVYTSVDAAADLPASYKVVPCTGGATSNAWVCTATAIQVGTPPAAGAKGVFASFILLIAAVLLL